MGVLKGESIAGSWPETTASFFTAQGKSGQPVDTPWVSSGGIALRSLESPLAAALAPHGEFLPVETPYSRYWLFNCTVVLGGATLPGTRADWLDDSRMLQLYTAEFDTGVIAGHPVFRIAELRTEILIDETIRAAYESSGAVGMEFDQVWSAGNADARE